jgi:hypothetical protein
MRVSEECFGSIGFYNAASGVIAQAASAAEAAAEAKAKAEAEAKAAVGAAATDTMSAEMKTLFEASQVLTLLALLVQKYKY